MYILRNDKTKEFLCIGETKRSPKTTSIDHNESINGLENVARFTKREVELNPAPSGHTWVWFGCYPELKGE